MKVTIEYDNEQEAIQALKADRWQGALWKLDQELRGIVKHGYIGNREATDAEIAMAEYCRKKLRQLVNDDGLNLDV